MAGFRIEGNVTGNVAEVDALNNLKANLPIVELDAGFAVLTAEHDAGTITGAAARRSLEVTPDFRLRTGQDNMVFNESFVGGAINTTIWSTPVTTMTVAVTNGFARLNSGSSVASGAVAQLRTYRHFPIYKTYTTFFEDEVQFSQIPQANNVCEWGLFLATGTATPTDGAFFRLTSTGEFRCILNNNGAETQSAALNFTVLVGVNTTHSFLIYGGSAIVNYWIDNILVASIARPAVNGSSVASMNLPKAFRNYNSAVTSLAQIMSVGNTNVTLGDQAMAKPWPHVICGAGGHASQGQTGGTLGSTTNYANSANPTAAVPTNTTAALGSGLGGQYWETDTLAVTTDGIISSFQVPAGTASIPGKSLYVTRITMSSFVQTALTGGGYVAQWSVAYGHNAVSLATTETATTKAPRRMSVGIHPVAAAAAANTQIGTMIDLNFDSPIVVHPGEFFQLVKKKVGVAPSAGVIAHVISVGGYME